MSEKAAIYLRVSTEDQVERYGLASQKRECERYAKRKGYKIVDTYADKGVTGTIADRPGIQKAIGDAQDGRYDVLIMYDHTRLARDRRASREISDDLQDSGVRLAFVSVGEIDSQSEGGIYLDAILEAASEVEVKKITERTSRGRRESAESGNVITRLAPFGYRKDDEHKKRLVIHEAQAKVVRRIYRDFNKGKSVNSIVTWLNENAPKPPDSQGVVYDWNHKNVTTILSSKTYVGTWAYGKSKNVKGKRVRVPEDEWIPVPVPPIVDQQTFDRAQERLEINRRTKRGHVKHEYLMRGRVHCLHCRRPFYCRSSEWKGRHYHYYIHDEYKKNRERSGCDNHRNINRDKIDGKVREYIARILTDPEYLHSELVKAHTRIEEHNSPIEEELELVIAQIESAKERKRKVTVAFVDGTGDLDYLKQESGRLDERLAKLREQRVALEDDLQLYWDLEEVSEEAHRQLLAYYEAHHEALEADLRDEPKVEKLGKMTARKRRTPVIEYPLWVERFNMRVLVDKEGELTLHTELNNGMSTGGAQEGKNPRSTNLSNTGSHQ